MHFQHINKIKKTLYITHNLKIVIMFYKILNITIEIDKYVYSFNRINPLHVQ